MRNKKIYSYLLLFVFSFLFSAKASAATLYWNTIYTADGDWNNLENWWLDQDWAVPSPSLPQADDEVVFQNGEAFSINVDNWVQPASIDGQGITQISFTSALGAEVSVELIDIEPLFYGDAIFSGTLISSADHPASFFDNSKNQATISKQTYFFDSSENSPTGYINNNAEFQHNSVNKGAVTGDITFRDYSSHDSESTARAQDVIFDLASFNIGELNAQTVRFDNDSYNSGIIDATGDTTFTAATSNANGEVTGHAIFEGTYTLSNDFGETGSKTIDTLNLSGSEVWSNQLANTTVLTWNFNDSSSNQGSIVNAQSVTFQGSASNRGSIDSDEVTFFDSTKNEEIIEAERVVFEGSSQNSSSGSVSASESVIFYGDLSENYGSLSSSSKKRQFYSSVTTNKNFIFSGPWTVVSAGSGTVVNYCNAVYSSRTVFLTEAGGTFAECRRGNINGGGNRIAINKQTPVAAPVLKEVPKAQLNVIVQKIEILKKAIENLKENKENIKLNFEKNLQLGDKDQDVIVLQKYLKDKGFFSKDYKTTDYFGLETFRALVAFQKSINIDATGFFGRETRSYINNN